MPDDLPLTREVDGVKLTLPSLKRKLEDGTWGWFQRGTRDCLRASVATATQIPYDDVPELRFGDDLLEWANSRALALDFQFHEPPVALERWIAVSPVIDEDGDGVGWRHTVVMRRHEVFFDPTSGWEIAGDFQIAPFTECEYAIYLNEGAAPC